MNTLPTHIGGYQHLQADVTLSLDDICVRSGVSFAFVKDLVAMDTVGEIERFYMCSVYRKYPVAKQGDSNGDWREKQKELLAVAEHNELARKQGEMAGAIGMAALKAALPTDAAKRKATPVFSGVLKYFPRAIAEVARVSQAGNDQHNPGKPLHWDRSKSGDELDALSRHLLEAGTFDTDGQRHSAKLCWRALANLEKELEAADGRT